METKTKHIGQLLNFSESAFNSTVSSLNWRLSPIIDELASLYEGLGIGSFDQQVLQGVMHGGAMYIHDVYKKAVDEDIKKSRFATKAAKESLMKGIELDLEPFETYKNKLHDTLSGLDWRTGDFSIVDGKLFIDREAIKKRYCTYVTTEQESELWEQLQQLKTVWDGIAAFAGQNGFKTIMPHFLRQHIGFDSYTGKMIIDPDSISVINYESKKAKYSL